MIKRQTRNGIKIAKSKKETHYPGATLFWKDLAILWTTTDSIIHQLVKEKGSYVWDAFNTSIVCRFCLHLKIINYD